MANCSQNRNPLQRSGTSQKQRQLPGLLPEYILIDERRYSDWIVFATQFAKYLKYYDTSTGAVSGTWEPFFHSDISALLGTIAVQNVELYRTNIKERINFIKDNDNAANDNKLKLKLSELFNAVFTLAKSLDNYYLQFADDVTYKTTLQQIIKVKLAPALRRVSSYYLGAVELHLLRDSDIDSWSILNLSITDAASIYEEGLSTAWWTDKVTSFADITPDISIYGEGVPKEGIDEPEDKVFQQISHAGNHHLFASVFDIFSGNYTRVISEAEKHLLQTLEEHDTHAPHYTLFLTFLKLFKNNQSQINGLTWRHLDFYYKEVLQLKPKEAIPNKVHLVAELAKHVPDTALAKGTLFKAGKDSSGKEVSYALDSETTFNKAVVSLYKAAYKGTATGLDDIKTSAGTVTINNKGRIYAAPVMNSADGAGAELKTENGEWQPFANRQYDGDGKLASIEMPLAETGFAVASHYLFLAEGTRHIYLRFDASATTLTKEQLTCYLTTEKEWYSIAPSAVNTTTFEGNSESCIEIVIDLPATAPAITAYDAKVHGGTYNVDVPVVKCVLKNDLGTDAYAYESLKDITITKTEIKVKAGEWGDVNTPDGLKQLSLLNQNGPIDATKPFQPFGASPEIGMSLIIGSKELFSKKNAAYTLNVEWGAWYATAKTKPTVNIQFLEGGLWKPAAGTVTSATVTAAIKEQLFSSLATISSGSEIKYSDEYNNYSPETRSGFMRLVLNGNFGHSDYLKELTVKLINAAKKTTDATTADLTVAVPYTPLINSIYLGYTAHTGAVALSSNDDNTLQFFHVNSFGEAERGGYLPDNKAHLIYHHDEFPLSDGSGNNFAGDWYIGIENLTANQSVNILFQLQEGSTNPLVSKPDNHVYWSYMSGDLWVPFEERDVNDATQQLVKSGIISFVIPDDATNDNTILPTGYIWLKASVSEAADAVCKILSVHAQAMSVSYLPNNNAADFLDTALAAGTISKFKIPDSSFKKIIQPYSSFGGRQTESSKQFYLRSSERLRHKGRAITIWDYEHLVLEAFPELHKVKCLNHTQVEDGETSIYNETKPGYVTIITVPNVANKNEINPLQPFTNQNVLSDIKAFLEERISGHVKVNVCNPLFEEIRLDFKLQLRDGYDDFTYYSKQLQDDITKYLSPWAYDQVTEIQFGGKINKSQLINFIEERSYVDFITEVKLFHRPGTNAAESTDDFEEVITTSARSVLVSAAASKHTVRKYGI